MTSGGREKQCDGNREDEAATSKTVAGCRLVEEGLGAAAAIGDDRSQRMSGRRVSQESFTHGSSEQRGAWFRRGLSTGDIGQRKTFP